MELLLDKKMNCTDLNWAMVIALDVLLNIGKGETVSMDNWEKISQALGCNVDGVIEFVEI